jgi:hypothetical protein
MWVKPAPGLLVPYPNSRRFLPPEGAEVNDGDLWWTRRIRDGDVTVEGQAAPKRKRAPHEPPAHREA